LKIKREEMAINEVKSSNPYKNVLHVNPYDNELRSDDAIE